MSGGRQSDSRVPGRARSGAPPSFGRATEEGEPEEDFRLRGGVAFHAVVHADVTPDAASMTILYDPIKEVASAATRAGVLEGYAGALAEIHGGMDDEAAAGAPGGDHGGTPPGQPGEPAT